MGNRRRFSREYKLKAVRMLDGTRGNLAQVSRDLGVSVDSLRRWRSRRQSFSQRACRFAQVRLIGGRSTVFRPDVNDRIGRATGLLTGKGFKLP